MTRREYKRKCRIAYHIFKNACKRYKEETGEYIDGYILYEYLTKEVSQYVYTFDDKIPKYLIQAHDHYIDVSDISPYENRKTRKERYIYKCNKYKEWVESGDIDAGVTKEQFRREMYILYIR